MSDTVRAWDADTLARELHDVAFAWNHTVPDWDNLRDEDRLWFTERARRMVGVRRESWWIRVRKFLQSRPLERRNQIFIG